MKSVKLLSLLSGALLAFAAAAQTEIKLGHVGEPGSLIGAAADEFAKRANARLGGKFKVVAYGSSQLGGDKEMLQKLKLGT
ncbi:MAG: TRAP transporter substrate-binding protein, partial [Pseudomonadota bacterium]